MASFGWPRAPPSPPNQPPSVYYLRELGLDYELQNSWLQSGEPGFLLEETLYPDFLDHFSASGEIMAHDMETVKKEKRVLFSHINIPISEEEEQEQEAKKSHSSIKPGYHNISPRLIMSSTEQPDHEPQALVANGKGKTDPEVETTSGSRKRKSIQAVCDDFKVLLNLPSDLNKLETLNLAIEYIEGLKKNKQT